MEKLSFAVCLTQTKAALALLGFVFVLSFGTKAQNRNLGFVYSENIKGGTALFGNTLMNAVNANGTVNTIAMNGNSVNGNSIYDNGGTTDMQYVDIDGNTGEGAGTRNSSSADLVLPAGTNTIKLARLYWGGRAVTSDFNMDQFANQIIKIRKGTSGAYQEYVAAQINKAVQNAGTSTEFSHYQAYTDITELIRQEGAGTYTVGNGAFSTGVIDDYGNYGAWAIMVVYENPLLNFNSVRVYDGYQQVYVGGSATSSSIMLTGLNVPSGALSPEDAKVGIMCWEGDARYTGDFLKINDNLYSDGLNPSNNSLNGTITTNGAHVTTKNPNYTDQMGIDIDEFNVGTGYGILPDASSVTLQLGTADDQFFCGIITIVIRMKDFPIISLTKTVTDANNSQTAEAGEVLTYTLKGKNISAGNANSMILTDSLPSTITYIGNSLKVNYCPGISAGIKTDASGDDISEYINSVKTVSFRLGNGANAVIGGWLAAADSFEVEFKVTVNTPASGNVPPITNVARLKARTDDLVDYVDDGTAVIGPPSGSLPVTLVSFTASMQQSKQVKVAWISSMEYNCSRYDIERSTDGVIFNTVATKAAIGNSSLRVSYFITDDITALNSSIVYYRLNQIDLNGRHSISKVTSVRLNKAIGNFNVSPNPFRNSVNIDIEWDKNETTVVRVFNVTGAEVVTRKVKMIKGYNYFALNELSFLPPGNYVIQFNAAKGKLIKQVIKRQ
ncbi:MAG: isopeptide-forming domain-containing fimbrial protein [Ferruginibacter sp.]